MRTTNEQREALFNLLNHQDPGLSNAVVALLSGNHSGDHEEATSAISNTILSTQTSQLCSVRLSLAMFKDCTVNICMGSSTNDHYAEPSSR